LADVKPSFSPIGSKMGMEREKFMLKTPARGFKRWSGRSGV
jgi:hypothetical protein